MAEFLSFLISQMYWKTAASCSVVDIQGESKQVRLSKKERMGKQFHSKT